MTPEQPKRRGGRPKTGTLGHTKDRRFRQPIVTLKDGSRKRLDPFPLGMSVALMVERTAFYAQKWADKLPERKATTAETIVPGGGAEWWESYLDQRHARGLSPVRHLYRPHIKPAVGDEDPPIQWTA